MAIFSNKVFVFYAFLCSHSLLIGLFPFYLGVYLYEKQIALSQIALFVAISGLGFCVGLYLLEYCLKVLRLSSTIAYSFGINILLLSCIFWENSSYFLYICAILSGFYGCYFYTLNRLLFFDILSTNDSGKKYGNLQIVVTIMLNIGIFIGGFLLQYYDYFILFVVSTAMAVVFSLLFWRSSLVLASPVQFGYFSHIVSFKDKLNSKAIFVLDGLFLFLESYFWSITLFLISKENFLTLGIWVISLSIVFALLFYVLKNTIDRLSIQVTYLLAIGLYSLSWILRGTISEDKSLATTFVILVSVTFFTAFFRLSFNKRFFDIAKESTKYKYLFLKSYYTQFCVFVWFALVAYFFHTFGESAQTTSVLYFGVSFLALGYALYLSPSATTRDNT